MKKLSLSSIALLLIGAQSLLSLSATAEEPLTSEQRFAYEGLYAEAITCAALSMSQGAGANNEGDTAKVDSSMIDIKTFMGMQQKLGNRMGKVDKSRSDDLFAELLAMNEVVGDDLTKISILDERHGDRCLKLKADAASVFLEYLLKYKE